MIKKNNRDFPAFPMTEKPTTSTEERTKLSTLDNVSTIPLITIRTVFPFRLFPCVLSLDREKLTISDSFFFSAKQVENFLAKDIVSVVSTENWIFASLTIVSGMRLNKEVTIPYLWKDDARRLRRMLEGLLIAGREGIDVMKIPQTELEDKLVEIGTSKM